MQQGGNESKFDYGFNKNNLLGSYAFISYTDSFLNGTSGVEANYGQFGPKINTFYKNSWIDSQGVEISSDTNIFGSVLLSKFYRSKDNNILADEDDILLQRIGGKTSFSIEFYDLNLSLGINLENVKPINHSFESKKQGSFKGKDIDLTFNNKEDNTLFSLGFDASYTTLADLDTPTEGSSFELSSQQFISVGDNSPSFNRTQMSYSYFIPTKFIGTDDEVIALELKAGTIIGELPPYEAFCLGRSVRGWHICQLGVGRSFGEATIEYRFPITESIKATAFLDAGTTFNTQEDVPGEPGILLDKPGQGFSPGFSVNFDTPTRRVYLNVATQNFTSEFRVSSEYGYKF